MTYSKGYVVAIRRNNQTVKEVGGKFVVPFHGEYEIRLKNKTRKRAVADVYIDGALAAEGIVVKANDHMDLERYLKTDLNKGARFKFVPLADGRVKDKGEPENGLIEVRFYPEKEPTPPPKEVHIHHDHYVPYHYDHCHRSYCYQCRRQHCGCEPCWPHRRGGWNTGDVWCSAQESLGKGMSLGGGGTTSSLGNLNTASFSPGEYNITANAGTFAGAIQANMTKFDAGATVEGSISNQSFSYTYIDVDRTSPVVVAVQLVGSNEPEELKAPADGPVPFCQHCGAKVTSVGNFCANCGGYLYHKKA